MTPRLRPLAAVLAGVIVLVALLVLAPDSSSPAPAAVKSIANPPAAVTKQLDALVARVRTKLKEADAAKRRLTEADLVAELKDFDALLAEHKSEQTDAVAEIGMMKAMLYVQVLEDVEKAVPLFLQVAKDFPRTVLGKEAETMASDYQKLVELEKITRALQPGTMFPAFPADLKDTAGQPFTLDRYKGKVVLVDFWATWCSQCLDELPNVLATYDKHHAAGFEILGISLDREGDGPKLAAFTKEHKMPWPQFYDGKFWENQLVKQYAVTALPTAYLLDREGRILGKNLHGAELEKAVAEALKK